MHTPEAVASPTRETEHRNPPLQLGPSTETAEGRMRIATKQLSYHPAAAPDLIDVTDDALEFVAGAGVRTGQLTLHSLHTTAAVVVNEREPLLHEDIKAFLERIAPIDDLYRHDDFDVRTVNMQPGERANAHAHLRHLMLGSTETLPIIGGRLALGQWQRIFLVELDGARERQLVLQVVGV